MGKSKQKENKETKGGTATSTTRKHFDRNVEISAPILDPEIIKQIHTPPKGQRLDIKNGGFKALLSDLNSQDSTDELMPLNDNHLPSYIGISCAVSGYANYSSYNKRSGDDSITPNRSRTASPITKQNKKLDHHPQPQIHHITIDRSENQSADEERKELTEKLTASAQEHRRSPSPCIQATEDDRHHGAYVGARYCPLPPPSRVVNKHIPLLGIDDEQNPDEIVEEENKVEQKIASLYGDEFVEDWRESMTHKAKKELACEQASEKQQQLRSPKDLVTLKPAPVEPSTQSEQKIEVDIPTPNVKVLASVEKQFLNKLLTDENPPTPSSENVTRHVTVATNAKPIISPPLSPVRQLHETVDSAKVESTTTSIEHDEAPPTAVIEPVVSSSPVRSPSPPEQHHELIRPMSADSSQDQPVADSADSDMSGLKGGEEHIEYEIRAESPVDNNSSPVRIAHVDGGLESIGEATEKEEESAEQNLVSFSPEPVLNEEPISGEQTIVVEDKPQDDEPTDTTTPPTIINDNEQVENLVDVAVDEVSQQGETDGRHFLELLETEMSFIREQISKAETILEEKESELDEDTVGRIRSAVGMATLLVNKKCKQFKELCDANINKESNGQFATLNDDLAGFWDMLNIQVNDVRKSFETLWKAGAENNWNNENNNNNNDTSGIEAIGQQVNACNQNI